MPRHKKTYPTETEAELTEEAPLADASAAPEAPAGPHLAGWKIEAFDYFKDGNIRLASGRVEWVPETVDNVTVQQLEQLEAAKPGNWKKLSRIHA